MAIRVRKIWLFAAVLAIALVSLLVLGWVQGGEQPLRAMSAPATLPGGAS